MPLTHGKCWHHPSYWIEKCGFWYNTKAKEELKGLSVMRLTLTLLFFILWEDTSNKYLDWKLMDWPTWSDGKTLRDLAVTTQSLSPRRRRKTIEREKYLTADRRVVSRLRCPWWYFGKRPFGFDQIGKLIAWRWCDWLVWWCSGGI